MSRIEGVCSKDGKNDGKYRLIANCLFNDLQEFQL